MINEAIIRPKLAYVTCSIIKCVAPGVCLCLTSYQQPGLYETGPHLTNSLIGQTCEAGDLTRNPWFSRRVVSPLHQNGSSVAIKECGISSSCFQAMPRVFPDHTHYL